MSYILPRLETKKDVDRAIKSTEDKVLVLRFGRETDTVCMQLDEILAKNQVAVSKMADIYIVDADNMPVYTKYFDITLVPATIFFFNGQHMKVDWGSDFDMESNFNANVSTILTVFLRANPETHKLWRKPIFVHGCEIKSGTPDHTKFIGSFKTSQDFIDVVEVVYRGAMKGKLIVTSPLDPQNVPKYSLLYKDI